MANTDRPPQEELGGLTNPKHATAEVTKSSNSAGISQFRVCVCVQRCRLRLAAANWHKECTTQILV